MNETITRPWSSGSIQMLEIQRSGSTPPVAGSTSVQVGAAAVPFAVRYSSPSLWPTQITFESPCATAQVEMLHGGLLAKCARTGSLVNGVQVRASLICVQ